METKTLLSLPAEIQQLIHDYIYVPWSLAVFDASDTHQRQECMVNVVHAGKLALSWPPGSNLLLTCRSVYNSVCHRYGSHFTGTFYLGRTRHADVTLQELPPGFRRWFDQVHNLHSPCLQSMRTLKGIPFHRFPHLQSFKGIVRDWQALECVRDGGIRAFLSGELDGRIVYYSRMGDVRGLYQTASMKENAPMVSESPRGFVLDLTLMAVDFADTSGWKVAGVRIREECNGATVVGRAAISDKQLHYWTNDWERYESRLLLIRELRDIPGAEEWRHAIDLTDFDLTLNGFGERVML